MACNFSNCFNGRRRPALVQPVRTVKALLDTVIDSCCKYDEIKKEIVIPVSALPSLADVNVGDTLPIMMDGPICCQEVKREEVIVGNPLSCNAMANNNCPSCEMVKACLSTPCNNMGYDPCTCLSTVLCGYPVKITDPCSCDDDLCQTFTSLHTVELDCTSNSNLDCQNSKVLSIACVVTNIDPEYVVCCVIIGARMCLRQVEVQEHCLNTGISCCHRCNDADLLGACCGSCTGNANDMVMPLDIPIDNCSCNCKYPGNYHK